MATPVVQMYDMSDAETQERVLGMLQDHADVTARLESSGPDHYIVVECDDPDRVRSIFTIVTSADPGATLIHTTNGRAPDFIRPRELELD